MMMKQKDKAILSSRPVRPRTQRGARRRPIPKKRGKQTSGRRRGRRLYGDYTLQSERIKPSFFSALLFTDNETYRGENALRRTRRATKKTPAATTARRPGRRNKRRVPKTTRTTEQRPVLTTPRGTKQRRGAGFATTPRKKRAPTSPDGRDSPIARETSRPQTPPDRREKRRPEGG